MDTDSCCDFKVICLVSPLTLVGLIITTLKAYVSYVFNFACSFQCIVHFARGMMIEEDEGISRVLAKTISYNSEEVASEFQENLKGVFSGI